MLSPVHLALRATGPLLGLGRHAPFVLQRLLIEQAMASLFAEPLADGSFACLQGRWLRLEVADLGLAWNVTRGRLGLQLGEHASADLLIRGNWREFLLLASRHEDPDTLFFRRRLTIEGDTELGLEIKNLIDSLDPEELPPRLWRVLRWLGAGVAADECPPVPPHPA
ncbi:ubiquinone anaerobic biosynthesis accessory factor UbiT [Halopseudomonas pelagia]|uniref:ubiquinone anaerobic biosynthesis accessory factor UbiT n=1 Tax=Halopseudomonas pelagia TaxID=553151 RepID=UPI0003A3C1FA|nr:SCP2 sterol-binding domain-containing protein [Halopseudomonas pelagia]|tara:strand:- start:87403 stop:87903 length:501 start_codon:yes stop_codon:yes gene_type:complete